MKQAEGTFSTRTGLLLGASCRGYFSRTLDRQKGMKCVNICSCFAIVFRINELGTTFSNIRHIHAYWTLINNTLYISTCEKLPKLVNQTLFRYFFNFFHICLEQSHTGADNPTLLAAILPPATKTSDDFMIGSSSGLIRVLVSIWPWISTSIYSETLTYLSHQGGSLIPINKTF